MVHAPHSLLHFPNPVTSDESTRWHYNSPPSSFFLPLRPNAPQQSVLEHNHVNIMKVYVGSRGTDPFKLGPCGGHRSTSRPGRLTAGECMPVLTEYSALKSVISSMTSRWHFSRRRWREPASQFAGKILLRWPSSWLHSGVVAYYDTCMSGTGYPAAGRNIPQGRSPYLFGRWEAVYLITLAVNWLIGISNNKDTDKNLSSGNTDNLTFLQIQTQTSIPGKKDIRQIN
jgi:hypothetical protein